jgi:hypothetical protein
MHPIRRRVVTACCLAALVAGATASPIAGAAPGEAPDPPAAGAARWLTGIVTDDGYVPGGGGVPNPGATLQVAIGLAAAGQGQDSFDAIVEWARADVDAAVQRSGVDDPGLIGYLLMVVALAGEDPISFGGVDLQARLSATRDAFEPGLYGAADPTFDGVFRQSVAILGLQANGLGVPAGAFNWLVDQQCDAPTAAAGGWTAYRPDTTVDCLAPDPNLFVGPETNSTALAVQAVLDVGGTPGTDPIAFLRSAQGVDGGFPFITGGTVDPNSTALVIQALDALDQGAGAPPWQQADGDTPTSSLRSWQIVCGELDAGALSSPFSNGDADQFATIQGTWGLAGVALPLGGVTWSDDDPCVDPVVPVEPVAPLDPAPPTDPGVTGTAANPSAAAPAARAVSAQPRITG